jgi:hypothetical protein
MGDLRRKRSTGWCNLRRPGRRGILHASTVAIVSQVPVSRLRHAIAVFPILREIYAILLNASGD